MSVTNFAGMQTIWFNFRHLPPSLYLLPYIEEQATAEPFSHLDVKAFGLAGTFKPASLDGDRTVGVIVKLKGESVGKQNADALKQGNGLSKASHSPVIG